MRGETSAESRREMDTRGNETWSSHRESGNFRYLLRPRRIIANVIRSMDRRSDRRIDGRWREINRQADLLLRQRRCSGER